MSFRPPPLVPGSHTWWDTLLLPRPAPSGCIKVPLGCQTTQTSRTRCLQPLAPEAAPRPRGRPTGESGPGDAPQGGGAAGPCPCRCPSAPARQVAANGAQLGRVPHSCRRAAPRELSGTQPAASGVSRRAAGILLIPPHYHPIIQHRRDPPAVPGARHRGIEKLPRPQAPPEPHSLLSPPCACPLPLPPPGSSSSHQHAGTPTAAAPMGKPSDNVTLPETAPAEVRTAHPATKL